MNPPSTRTTLSVSSIPIATSIPLSQLGPSILTTATTTSSSDTEEHQRKKGFQEKQIENDLELAEIEAVTIVPDELKQPVCPACLGILQINQNTLAQKGFEMFKSLNYSIPERTFNLQIRLPFQLPIRHQAIIHHISGVIEDKEAFALPAPVEVKEVFKYLVRDSFAKASGFEFDNLSPLSYSFHIQHVPTETDYEFLTKIPAAKFEVKKSRKKVSLDS